LGLIRADGFNGITVTIWAADFRISTNIRLRDGEHSNVTKRKFVTIANPATGPVDPGNDRLYYNGPTIQIYNSQFPECYIGHCQIKPVLTVISRSRKVLV
jgi:hypothetical protein